MGLGPVCLLNSCVTQCKRLDLAGTQFLCLHNKGNINSRSIGFEERWIK